MEKVPDGGRTGSHGTRVTKIGDYKKDVGVSYW